MTRSKTWLAALLVTVASAATSDAAVIRDFNSGIGAVADTPPPANNDTWYDSIANTFGTPVAGNLDGSPALRINDGGFTNGVYIVLPGVIPTTGAYKLAAKMKVTEDTTQLNSIRAYQMGAVVNGAHRPNAATPLAGVNAAAPGSGVANYLGLTSGDNNGLPTQTIITDPFSAVAGDNLLVALGTDVTSGLWNGNSATWGANAFVQVDDLELIFLNPPTVQAAVYGPPYNANGPGNPQELEHQFTATDPDSPSHTWDMLTLVSYTALYGGAGPGPAVAPTLSASGLFEWTSQGSPRGEYIWQVRAMDPDGVAGTGTITVHVTAVPEPASAALLAVSLLGLGLVTRRRK